MRKFLVAAAFMLSCGAVVAAEQAQSEQAQVAPAPTASSQDQTRSPDLTTPEAAVRSFIGAINKGDLKLAARCVAGTHLEDKLPDSLQQLQGGMRQGKVTFTVKNLRVEAKGDDALAFIQAELRPPKSPRPETLNQRLPLHREGGVWKIFIRAPDTAMKEPRNKDQIFQGLAVMLMRPQLMDAAQAGARANALAASCRNNLKRLSMAAYQSLFDHDDKFAFKANSFQKSLMALGVPEEAFICPEDKYNPAMKGSKKVVSSYSFNANLEGVALGKIKRRATTVLFYEGHGGKLNFRHKGRATVAFADGNVSMVNAQGAKTLSWKP